MKEILRRMADITNDKALNCLRCNEKLTYNIPDGAGMGITCQSCGCKHWLTRRGMRVDVKSQKYIDMDTSDIKRRKLNKQKKRAAEKLIAAQNQKEG